MWRMLFVCDIVALDLTNIAHDFVVLFSGSKLQVGVDNNQVYVSNYRGVKISIKSSIVSLPVFN